LIHIVSEAFEVESQTSQSPTETFHFYFYNTVYITINTLTITTTTTTTTTSTTVPWKRPGVRGLLNSSIWRWQRLLLMRSCRYLAMRYAIAMHTSTTIRLSSLAQD